MKTYILRPFDIFKKEKAINAEIKKSLMSNHQINDTKAKIIYFFVVANIMLLLINLIVYFSIILVIVTTPFNPPIALLRLLPPLFFLLILRPFQMRWLPKVRHVQMETIGLDIHSITQKYN